MKYLLITILFSSCIGDYTYDGSKPIVGCKIQGNGVCRAYITGADDLRMPCTMCDSLYELTKNKRK